MGAPTLVKIVSAVYLGLGIIGVVSLFADVPFVGFVGWGIVAAYPVYGIGLVGIPQLVLSWALWKQKRWAYWLTILACIGGLVIALWISQMTFLVLAILTIIALGVSHGGYMQTDEWR